MKLTIIILSTIVLIAFVGMFYWMYKARKGSLNLSKNAWHFKLINYMWEAEVSEIRNACPYYWSLVLSILIFIPYLIPRYLYVFQKYICSLFPEKKEKEVKVKSEIKKTTSKYSFIYSKSKQILEQIMIIILCISVLYIIIFNMSSLYETSFRTFIICILIILYLAITLYLHTTKPELDTYHWNQYKNFFSGLWGILKIPFIVVGWILSSIFSKITNVYIDNCPAIIWKD